MDLAASHTLGVHLYSGLIISSDSMCCNVCNCVKFFISLSLVIQSVWVAILYYCILVFFSYNASFLFCVLFFLYFFFFFVFFLFCFVLLLLLLLLLLNGTNLWLPACAEETQNPLESVLRNSFVKPLLKDDHKMNRLQFVLNRLDPNYTRKFSYQGHVECCPYRLEICST